MPPHCPLFSTMMLHNRSHRCLVWLQKSCLSGIIWCCAEEGAQYLLSTRQCHSAVTMLHRLLHSELAHFLRSSRIHAAFWAAFGPYLSNTECVNNPGRTQNLLNPAEVFPLPGYSLFSFCSFHRNISLWWKKEGRLVSCLGMGTSGPTGCIS